MEFLAIVDVSSGLKLAWQRSMPPIVAVENQRKLLQLGRAKSVAFATTVAAARGAVASVLAVC